MRKVYASELTQDMLVKMGVCWIDPDTLTVYGSENAYKIHANKEGYLMINLYELDEDGNKIKMPSKVKYIKKDGEVSYYESYYYKVMPIILSRVIFAWFDPSHKIPKGYVVDHISNKHDELNDYRINNLQLLTPAQNIMKERKPSDRVIKAGKGKTIEHYQSIIMRDVERYEQAKLAHDAELVHKIRSNIYNNKAKIRYLLRMNETKVDDE